MADGLSLWVIYRTNTDSIQPYIARRWLISEGAPQPTLDIIHRRGLAALRLDMAQRGLVRMGRAPGDNPTIVESWL